MKRITLASVFAALVIALPAVAQDPTPPTPPARPAQPVPVTPAPAPRAIRVRPPLSDYDVDRLREQTREIEQMSRDAQREMQRAAMIDQRELLDAAREANRIAIAKRPELDQMARDAARLGEQAAREFKAFPQFAPIPPMTPMPAMAPMAPMTLGPAGAYRVSDDFVRRPPAPWAQGDPADSLYRIARNALNGGEYGRAAKMFQEISQKYPKSVYQADAPYYEAWARYRIGTNDELHQAVKLLEPLVAKVSPNSAASTNSNSVSGQKLYYAGSGQRGASDNDVLTLYLRINGALAQRGDRDAADRVAKTAKIGGSVCDEEDVRVKIEALSALSQMDPSQATPLLRRVLDRKDECSIELRRRAVFMLGRRGDTESANLLVTTAKSDPAPSVRSEAIGWLPRLPDDVGVNSLEEILRNEQDERIQRAVVSALMSSDNQKARSGMRGLIDRKDASVNLRVEAINSFNAEHATTDDAAYLRNLYGKADNDRVKDAVVQAVARIGGPENDTWVLNLAKNTNEPSQFRSTAISRLMRSNTISVADLGKLYDGADSYNIRQQIIGVLERRKEPEATDKLVDIVRNSITDTRLRTQAIGSLGRRNDPRSAQLLQDILDGKKP